MLSKRIVTAQLVIQARGRRLQMAPNTLGKLLYLAHSHGWRPEKEDQKWPSASWNTELILPHIGPYMPGVVSDKDAHALASALREILATGDSEMSSSLYLALMVLLRVADHGEFSVRLEAETPEKADALLATVAA